MNSNLILLFFLISMSAKSQDVINKLDTLVVQTRKKMNENHIHNYLIFTRSAFSDNVSQVENDKGEVVSSKTVLVNQFEAYIFWQEDTKCFLKHVNSDFSSKTVEITQCDFLVLNEKSIARISKEKVLPTVFLDRGKKITIEQPIHYDTKFYFEKTSSETFPDYYLFRLDKKNLNYKANSELKIGKLYQICQKSIEDNYNKLLMKE